MRKKLARALLDLEVRNDRAAKNTEKRAILALDYGEKYTGIAFSPDGSTVLPGSVVLTKTHLEKTLADTLSEKSIELIVIGLPLGIHGEENHICQEIRDFAKKLAQTFEGTIDFVNERYSSQSSLEIDSKRRVDDLAAMNILEYYLSHKS